MESEIAHPRRLIIGEWLVRPLEGLVERAGERRHLRPKSMDVLALLASRPYTVVPREEFFRRVWDGDFVDEASLARCIAEIRAVLGDDAREPRYVETVPRRGYRLIAPVSEGKVCAFLGLAGGRFSWLVEAGSRWWRRRRLLAAVTALLAVVAVGLLLGWRRNGGEGTPGHAEVDAVRAPDPRPAVAIAGVRRLSGDEAYDWLQPALEQMLTTELAASDLGRAVPADVAQRAARELSIAPTELTDPETLRRLATALGAAYLVTGSFLTGGEAADAEELRIDLLVHDGASGEVIEGIVETGSVGELSSLVLSAGRRLRGRLGFGDGPADRAGGPSEGVPSSPEAARLYFQAVLELGRGEAETARGLLDRTLAIDPASPLAHLALAEAWALLGYDPRASASAAEALARTAALPVEDRLWTEARAYSLTSDWPAAVERLATLRLLSPDSLEYGLALADAQSRHGDFAAALGTVEELRPRTSFQGTLGRIALIETRAAIGLADYPRAVDAARRAQSAAERVDAPLVQGRALEGEASALYQLGQVDDARAALGRAMEIFDHADERRAAASARTILSGWLREQGRHDEAWRLAEAAVEVFHDIGDRRGESSALRGAAGGRWQHRSAAEGEAALRRSIELCREIGDRTNEANSLTYLAILRAIFGGEGVDDLLEEALAIYREIDKRDGIASSLSNLSKVALYEGEVRLAIERLDEAEAIFAELAIPDGRGNALFNLGGAYYEAGEIARSAEALREAARIFEELDNDRMVAASLEGLAKALIASGELTEARRHLTRSGELQAELGEPLRILQGRLVGAYLLLAEGDPHRALEVARQVRDEADRLPVGSPGLRKQAEDALAEVHLELGRPGLAREVLFRDGALGAERELTVNLSDRRLLEARVLAASGEAAEARDRIDGVRAFAAPRGLDRLRLEAELLRAEIEAAGTGSGPGSEPGLADLEAELRRHGLVLLADRARRLLPAERPDTLARKAP